MDETNMNAAYSDFFDTFDSGYQTETEDAPETDEVAEAADDTVSEENNADEISQEDSENPAQGEDKPEETAPAEVGEQMFTIRVNHEDRSLSLAEMTALAQKGADYDRVKAQAEKLLGFQTENKALVDAVKRAAEKTGGTMQEIVDSFRLNLLKGDGLTDGEARERMAREDAEGKLKTYEEKERSEEEGKADLAQRAQREVAELNAQYPDVRLTPDVLAKIKPYLDGGKVSLVNAYTKLRAQEQDDRIRSLEQEIAAFKQNSKNRNAPGSMKDSGGTKKTDEDTFFSIFNYK